MIPRVPSLSVDVCGKILAAGHLWKTLSTDTWIYDIIHSNILEFSEVPIQILLPRPLTLSAANCIALDTALVEFIERGVVDGCDSFVSLGFYSNVFPTIKKDGTA